MFADKKRKFQATKFLIAEFERANIDDGKKVVIMKYLKTLSPVLFTYISRGNL